MGNKVRKNISLSVDTADRLKKYADQNHKNVSQAITDWIWSVKIDEDDVNMPGKEKNAKKADFDD